MIKNYYPVEKDPRVTKLLKILSEGYHITYIGWDINASSYFSYKRRYYGQYEEIIMYAKAPFGYSFFLFPLWWLFGFVWLVRLDWNIVHVVNFPSIIPAILAAKLKNNPVIYDVEDTYIDQLPTQRVRLRNLGLRIDKLSMRFVDAVVLVDEMQVEEFGGIPNRNIVVVYDSPPPIPRSSERIFERTDFQIFYAGGLSKGRHLNLESFIEAITSIEGVKAIFAGNGDLVKEILSAARKMPDKILYAGWVPYNKVLEMSLEADLLFSLRDPDPPVQKYICGSKFLEAVMCGKPILVNRGTSVAAKVMENECGVVVDAHDAKEIKEAISKLKDDKEFWTKLAINAKKAYEQKYDWEIIKQRLLGLYSMILNEN